MASSPSDDEGNSIDSSLPNLYKMYKKFNQSDDLSISSAKLSDTFDIKGIIDRSYYNGESSHTETNNDHFSKSHRNYFNKLTVRFQDISDIYCISDNPKIAMTKFRISEDIIYRETLLLKMSNIVQQTECCYWNYTLQRINLMEISNSLDSEGLQILQDKIHQHQKELTAIIAQFRGASYSIIIQTLKLRRLQKFEAVSNAPISIFWGDDNYLAKMQVDVIPIFKASQMMCLWLGFTPNPLMLPPYPYEGPTYDPYQRWKVDHMALYKNWLNRHDENILKKRQHDKIKTLNLQFDVNSSSADPFHTSHSFREKHSISLRRNAVTTHSNANSPSKPPDHFQWNPHQMQQFCWKSWDHNPFQNNTESEEGRPLSNLNGWYPLHYQRYFSHPLPSFLNMSNIQVSTLLTSTTASQGQTLSSKVFWDSYDHHPGLVEAAVSYPELFPKTFLVPPIDAELQSKCRKAEIHVFNEFNRLLMVIESRKQAMERKVHEMNKPTNDWIRIRFMSDPMDPFRDSPMEDAGSVLLTSPPDGSFSKQSSYPSIAPTVFEAISRESSLLGLSEISKPDQNSSSPSMISIPPDMDEEDPLNHVVMPSTPIGEREPSASATLGNNDSPSSMSLSLISHRFPIIDSIHHKQSNFILTPSKLNQSTSFKSKDLIRSLRHRQQHNPRYLNLSTPSPPPSVLSKTHPLPPMMEEEGSGSQLDPTVPMMIEAERKGLDTMFHLTSSMEPMVGFRNKYDDKEDDDDGSSALTISSRSYTTHLSQSPPIFYSPLTSHLSVANQSSSIISHSTKLSYVKLDPVNQMKVRIRLGHKKFQIIDKMDLHYQNMCVTKIQCQIRKYLARRKVQRTRQMLYYNQYCIKIQCSFRIYKAKRYFSEVKRRYQINTYYIRRKALRIYKAAILITQFFRKIVNNLRLLNHEPLLKTGRKKFLLDLKKRKEKNEEKTAKLLDEAEMKKDAIPVFSDELDEVDNLQEEEVTLMKSNHQEELTDEDEDHEEDDKTIPYKPIETFVFPIHNHDAVLQKSNKKSNPIKKVKDTVYNSRLIPLKIKKNEHDQIIYSVPELSNKTLSFLPKKGFTGETNMNGMGMEEVSSLTIVDGLSSMSIQSRSTLLHTMDAYVPPIALPTEIRRKIKSMDNNPSNSLYLSSSSQSLAPSSSSLSTLYMKKMKKGQQYPTVSSFSFDDHHSTTSLAKKIARIIKLTQQQPQPHHQMEDSSSFSLLSNEFRPHGGSSMDSMEDMKSLQSFKEKDLKSILKTYYNN